jgi:hypothetical protein
MMPVAASFTSTGHPCSRNRLPCGIETTEEFQSTHERKISTRGDIWFPILRFVRRFKGSWKNLPGGDFAKTSCRASAAHHAPSAIRGRIDWQRGRTTKRAKTTPCKGAVNPWRSDSPKKHKPLKLQMNHTSQGFPFGASTATSLLQG